MVLKFVIKMHNIGFKQVRFCAPRNLKPQLTMKSIINWTPLATKCLKSTEESIINVRKNQLPKVAKQHQPANRQRQPF